MNYEKEEWRDIQGYKGLYQVSNKGQVRSLSHYAKNNINSGMRLVKGKILIAYKMPNGYLQVQLSKGNSRKKMYIHRLVAISFLENEHNLSDVNHKDGNKNNNCVNNLEWVTHKDNQIHMVKNRMTKKAQPVICLNTNIEYCSLSDAERMTGIDRHIIKKVCENNTEYKGKQWRFV